ncbi:putative damage-inducible protein dinI-like [Escherichia coli]|uniref:Putative damage-inducible protein dinI-like n=1 Tax=Escherichia coli TaxID=562 RepID=A0A377D795_ECOLX|nr:putative damage-inducible protein dinI-like [Escherichia coli]
MRVEICIAKEKISKMPKGSVLPCSKRCCDVSVNVMMMWM